MARVKVEAFLYHKTLYSGEQKFILDDYAELEEIDSQVAFVGTYEAQVEVPNNFDPVARRVASLRRKQEKLRAEAEAAFQNLEGQIQELLCLPATINKEGEIL